MAGKLDYLSKSFWLLAGACDSNCYPADRSVTRGPLGANTDTRALSWIYDLADSFRFIVSVILLYEVAT